MYSEQCDMAHARKPEVIEYQLLLQVHKDISFHNTHPLPCNYSDMKVLVMTKRAMLSIEFCVSSLIPFSINCCSFMCHQFS